MMGVWMKVGATLEQHFRTILDTCVLLVGSYTRATCVRVCWYVMVCM